ncbi:cysteine hydrolase family protein [Chloroflexota bacterium]
MITCGVDELLDWVDVRNSAILVVDVQNDYCHEDGCFARGNFDVSFGQKMVPDLNKFLTEARKCKVPILHIQSIHGKWTNSPVWISRHRRTNIDADKMLQPDSWGVEFYKVLPRPNDYIVAKHRYSAFVDTELDVVLRSQGIKTIIVAGVLTNVCVELTAWHGFMKDYYVVVLEDCTAACSTEDHETALVSMGKSFVIATSATAVEALRRAKN